MVFNRQLIACGSDPNAQAAGPSAEESLWLVAAIPTFHISENPRPRQPLPRNWSSPPRKNKPALKAGLQEEKGVTTR